MKIIEWFSANSDVVQAITAVIVAIGVFVSGAWVVYKHFWESSEPAPPPADVRVAFERINGQPHGLASYKVKISNGAESISEARDIELLVDGKLLSEHKQFRLIEPFPNRPISPGRSDTFRIEYSPSEPYQEDSHRVVLMWADSDGKQKSTPESVVLYAGV